MKLIVKNKSFFVLDSYLHPDSVRIKVQAICNLEKINNQYFVREKSFRTLYNYYREVGIKSVIQKTVSRLREKNRNEKYFSIGIGEIIESNAESFVKNTMVFFIATNHPACSERMVISKNFIFPVNSNDFPWLSNDAIFWINDFNQKKWWSSFIVWSPYAGLPTPSLDNSIREKITAFWKSVSEGKNEKKYVSLKKESEVSDFLSAKKNILWEGQKFAALFGYGNYAKTMLMPNLNKNINIKTIHEIDPTQLIPLKKNVSYDTCPYPRENKKHDIYFIAGYHHTHTDIAVAGLNNGIDVVVEKPLVTTRDELKKIVVALQQSSAKYYACFQRRYHRFNDYLFEDFKIKKGDPVSYFAIIYEESLPEFHWYRWPNSRSAIISNGCHWIDHFLFINHYSSIIDSSAKKTKDGDIIVIVSLENGATLSLTLSHTGSPRIGMQEYFELRSLKNTAKITNGNIYFSENASRIIRKSKIDKYESYKKMYRLISDDMLKKNHAMLNDSWQKIEMVSALILSLDEQVTGA